jgi:hypothetical protein
VRDGEFTDREVGFRTSIAPARAAASGTFRAPVRDAHGGWILLHAGRLVPDDDGETAVTIERASGAELLGVLLAAYGLTGRERDVCREVLAGRSTSDIAARLAISAHTVPGELTAKLPA